MICCLDYMDEIMQANIHEKSQELVTFQRSMAFKLRLQAGDTADLQHSLRLSKNKFSTDS
jgi:hypothetical protein